MEIFIVYAIIFRLAVLLTGAFIIYLGYRLFVESVIPRNEAKTDLDFEAFDIKLSMKNAAPGTCIAIFGAILVCLMVVQGNPSFEVNYENGTLKNITVRGEIGSKNLSADQVKKLERHSKQIVEQSLISNEAKDPLFGIAEIYFEAGWYGNSMAIINLIELIDTNEKLRVQHMREHITRARGY